MEELAYFKTKDRDTVVIVKQSDGTYEVACYDRSDIGKWSMSGLSEMDAWDEFRRRRKTCGTS